jgi:hypothetical protein
MIWVDGVAPGGGVLLVDKLGYGNLGEVGIAHEIGAVIEGATKGFGFKMDGVGGAVAELGVRSKPSRMLRIRRARLLRKMAAER